MASTTPTNLSCARCHRPEALLDQPLKRCSGCHSIQYCSRECQRLDWPQHKRHCRQAGTASSAQPRTRTTMRLSMADLLRTQGQGAEEQDTTSIGTIYYLRTATPHLHDISVSGPYHSLDAVVPQVMQNFGNECRPGQMHLQDLTRDGHLLAGFEHITSPINGDPNKTRTIRLIKEHNPTMAARLPGPAWCVVISEMMYDATMIAMKNPATSGREHIPVKDKQVHGTFESQASANEAAQTLAQDLAARTRGGRVVGNLNGPPGMFVLGEAEDGGRLMTMVEAHHDRGH